MLMKNVRIILFGLMAMSYVGWALSQDEKKSSCGPGRSWLTTPQ
jgi:hypothetical protein